MKSLILFGVFAVALAAPIPDEDCDNIQLIPGALPYAGYGLGAAGYGLGAAGYGLSAAGYGLGAAGYGLGAAVAGAAPIAQWAGAAPYAQWAGEAPIAQWAGAAPYAQWAGEAPIAHLAGAAPYAQWAGAAAPIAHPVAYAAPVPVALPPKEVQIPITRTHVEVPVHQKVHYGTQSYVAGATTTIHKPSLAAAAIAPPTTLLSKVTHNLPEVTIKQQEIPVERHTPNFVDTPYHAGTIIEYTEPEIKEIKVPTPYAQPVPVPHPVPVAQPVPVPTPVHSVAVHAAAPVALQAAVPVAYGAAIVAAADC